MKSKRELLDGIEPGTTIYCLEEDGYVGYLYMATCKDYVLATSEYIHCLSDFDNQLKEMSEVFLELGETDIHIFSKDKVFISEEAAKQALGK